MNDTPKVRRIPAYRKNPHLMKAAIYVRVSSSRVEQLRSLSNQVSAMTRCVYLMQNWILKDIYLEVASAKTDSYRREFNRLLDDCKKKEIEVVVVKSLSRFGRDNVEVIDSIRALVNASVTIYFMEEDIDVDADYPEWELSIRSAINQAENEHRSENIKMGLRYRAESGNSGLYKKPCYGYVKGADGNLENVKYTGNVEVLKSSARLVEKAWGTDILNTEIFWDLEKVHFKRLIILFDFRHKKEGLRRSKTTESPCLLGGIPFINDSVYKDRNYENIELVMDFGIAENAGPKFF